LRNVKPATAKLFDMYVKACPPSSHDLYPQETKLNFSHPTNKPTQNEVTNEY
jgi:hypothetical protein